MRSFWLALAAFVCVLGARNVALAQDNDNDADDGFMKYSFNVPAVPEDFGKSSPGGWGALVLQFNGPAGGNGLEGASFTFMPACPGLTPGTPDDLNSDFPNIQLGPGRYRLFPTGDTVPSGPFQGQTYGTFDVIVEYELGAPGGPPQITSAFWQNKLTIQSGPNKGQTNWTFDSQAPSYQDLAVATIPAGVSVPEPAGALTLAACGACALVRRRTKLTA